MHRCDVAIAVDERKHAREGEAGFEGLRASDEVLTHGGVGSEGWGDNATDGIAGIDAAAAR